MGSNLGQSRGITKDIKSQLGDSNCKSRRNALAKTSCTHYHTELGFQYIGRRINGWVVCYS